MNDPHLVPDFKEKWDSASNHETGAITFDSAEASQFILQTLKTKRKAETAQWLSGLEKDISASTNTAPEPVVENTIIGQIISWLDKIFVQFELYASEFNLNVRGTNLVVSCTRPIKRTNDTGGLYSEETDNCLNYAGHIATQLWALVVRGCTTKVEFFIIPSDLLLAFSVSHTDESGYEPLLVIEPTERDNEIIWHIQEHIITADQIPSLAKELFGDLIKVASGQMSEAELIANPPQVTTLNENSVVTSITTPAAPIAKTDSRTNISAATSVSGNVAPNPTTTLPKTAQQSPSTSLPSLESLKGADQLLASLDKDINRLMESGKKALEADDTGTFEQVKVLTEKLEALKKTISIALASIRQITK